NLESWKRYALSFFTAALGQPLFYLLAIGWGLGRYVNDMGGMPYAGFLTPGIIVTAAMNSATLETTFRPFTRLTQQHTHAAILATPCAVADVVAGDILWGASKSVVSSGSVLLLAALAGLVPSPLAIALLPVGFLIGLCFGALGMIATAQASSYDTFN